MSISTHRSSHGSGILFDDGLIRRYDVPGPRYTSYPTAPQFHEGYGEQSYRENVRESNGDLVPKPLSLYFHLPFCAHVCFYCACNRIITANRAHAYSYVDSLVRELRLQASLFDDDRQVSQVHWGGGTPTFLPADLMRRLMEETRRSFSMANDNTGEYSVEIDPREATPETIGLLRELGFNRLSIGIQDFDPRVQAAINRRQSFEETEAVIVAARECGFRSVSVDLIYGLPCQSVESFSQSLDKVLSLKPDRISTYSYAHLPGHFKSQRQIDASELPDPEVKLAIFRQITEQLTAAGYVYIGMDHFALPDDELTIAQQNGLLQRNFQGYSTHGDCDLIGMGISSIGAVGGSYSQNVRGLDDYHQQIDSGRIPVFRGVQLGPDDRLRRDIIMSLLCHFRIEFRQLEQKYGFDFNEYFAGELANLKPLRDDGLLWIGSDSIVVTPSGRLLIRNICMAFDAYLRSTREVLYSRTI